MLKKRNRPPRPDRELRPITVYCEPAFAARVEAEADADGRKVSQMARRLMEESLTARENARKAEAAAR